MVISSFAKNGKVTGKLVVAPLVVYGPELMSVDAMDMRFQENL